MNTRATKILSAALLLGFGWMAPLLAADELYLCEANAFPGKLLVSRDGRSVEGLYRRPPAANPAYPHAVMKAAQITLDANGKIFFCSGLDKYVFHLMPGGHEIAVLETEGQVRDVAGSDEEQVVYYSVLDTPQSAAPLGDGVIYRRNLGEGRPHVIATIRQADIGGNWWGGFTVANGDVYLFTHEPNSRVFRWNGVGPQLIGTANGFSISGLARTNDDQFLFTTDTGKVYRTRDFSSFDAVLTTEVPLRDVAVRPVAGALRPLPPPGL